MNDQLQKAVTDLIAGVTSATDKATTFLSSEIPEAIQQLLMWKAIYSAAMCVLGVLIMAAWVFIEKVAFKAAKAHDENTYADTFAMGYLMFGSIVRCLLVVTVAALMNLDWLQIMIAPKVYLIEYASKLVTK